MQPLKRPCHPHAMFRTVHPPKRVFSSLSKVLRCDRSRHALVIPYAIYSRLRVPGTAVGVVSAVLWGHFVIGPMFLVAQLSLLKVTVELLVFCSREKIDGEA